MSWAKVIEAHTAVAVKLYPPDTISKLSKESGIQISPSGNNSASHPIDVERYLKAVETVLGGVALVSAKMKISGKKQELGL